MARRGLTQTSLAPMLGITQSGLSKRLSGTADWRIPELYLLAAALGVPLSTFLPELKASA